MCKQIRHIYYCEGLFLIKHKTKHSCESAIFYNLTADVVYSVCQFDYFYNTKVPPSILDGYIHMIPTSLISYFIHQINHKNHINQVTEA